MTIAEGASSDRVTRRPGDTQLRASFEACLQAFNDALDSRSAREEAYYARLNSAVSSGDQTVVLIQGQLFVENELTNLIRNVAVGARRDRVGGARGWRPPFSDKLSLLHILGLLSDDDRTALAKLNAIRNDVAHVNLEDEIPLVTDDHIHELWSSVSSTLRAGLGVNYDRQRPAVENLREIVIGLVIRYRILVDVTSGEFGLSDAVRYNVTGETVMQRIEKQRQADRDDNAELRAIKEAVSKLSFDNRRDLRLWMREIYHHD